MLDILLLQLITEVDSFAAGHELKKWALEHLGWLPREVDRMPTKDLLEGRK